MYKPTAGQFATSIRIKHRVETDINGAPEISYEDAATALDFCSWKGRGGSESAQSGSLVVDDTAELTMWFRPDITERDIIMQEETETEWQIQYDALVSSYEIEVEASGADSEVATTLQGQIDTWLAKRPAYEIVNIENVEMRNIYMILKVRRVVGA